MADLRVLPLGGLGEIGKNMTVVEHDGRIVVVDVGLRFPTPEMVGIDLVLPDFAYLRERVDDIEAIVITHGHEDHLGALPWVIRELDGFEAAGVRGSADHRDGPLEARRAQAARRRPQRDRGRRSARAGPVLARARPHDPLDPGLERRGARHGAGDGPDHRRLQVRPDPGGRAAGRRLAARRTGARGSAAAVRGLDERRPRRLLAVGVRRRAAPGGGVRPLPRADRGHELRLQHPPRAAGRGRRRGARAQGRAGRALDAQERRHRPQPRAHRDPRGDARRTARDH